MQSGYLQYRSARIHFITFGSGAKPLIAFHGFSENGTSFLALEPSLGKYYTVYAFDIPWHGDTEWNERDIFRVDDLHAIIAQFIAEHGLQRFSILGFSMGGKCALIAAQYFAAQVDDLLLMASDGIATNRIYNIAVYPKWGRNLFKTTIDHPGWFFFFIRTLRFLHILTPWLLKFTQNHMATREKRLRLYNTWTSMAQFNPDIPATKAEIINRQIRVYLFFGKRDEVIPPAAGNSFAAGLPLCKLTLLERGHYFIDDALNPYLDAVLQPTVTAA